MNENQEFLNGHERALMAEELIRAEAEGLDEIAGLIAQELNLEKRAAMEKRLKAVKITTQIAAAFEN